jgi:ArsR family transcriptional regulator, arsenate/arsenite/antimonite-responsive transcriptional repressor
VAAGLGERQVAVTSAANRKTLASTNHLQNQNFGYFDRMTTTSPNARALAALGHDARLSIFRLLVKAGEEGLRVGDIGDHLGLAPSTLAHHLSTLVDAGLVLQDKQGREVFNRVDFAAMRRVLGFLTSECCSGVTVRSAEDAA